MSLVLNNWALKNSDQIGKSTNLRSYRADFNVVDLKQLTSVYEMKPFIEALQKADHEVRETVLHNITRASHAVPTLGCNCF